MARPDPLEGSRQLLAIVTSGNFILPSELGLATWDYTWPCCVLSHWQLFGCDFAISQKGHSLPCLLLSMIEGENILLKSDHSLVCSRSHSCSRALIWCLNWPARPPPPCTRNTHALEPGQERLMTRRDFPRISSMLYPSSFLSTSSGLNMSIVWQAQSITWLNSDT